VPADAVFSRLNAMSGDGNAFAGTIGRAGERFTPPYPARVDAQGVVKELPGYGVSGTAFGINADGSVLVGELWCDGPPDCESYVLGGAFRWDDGQAPTAVYRSGSAMVVTSSGNTV